MVKNNKIIKDLKERNDKLVNQYRDKDIRCVSLERQLEKLQQENLKLKIQVSAREEVANKYKEVIDKAVEYIEKHLTDNGRFLMLNEWQVPDLLRILKEVE
jgi:hypothetical protein